MQYPDARILLFARAPVPGQVKTRLIPAYGARGAARIHRELVLERVRALSGDTVAPLELWAAADAGHRFFRACARRFGLVVRRQGEGDLGLRMHDAMARTLARARSAVIVGADCASVDGPVVADALARLEGGDEAVIGPAEDGGYVLVGLRQPCPELFAGMPWGRPGLLEATRMRLAASGLRWSELATGWDVDRPQDVQRWRAQRGSAAHATGREGRAC